MNRRLALAALLLATLLLPPAPPAGAQSQYDLPVGVTPNSVDGAPRAPGSIEETNNPPALMPLPERTPTGGPYKPVKRNHPPTGVRAPAPGVAAGKAPSSGRPLAAPDRPDRHMRPWPDGAVDASPADADTLRKRAEALLAEDEFMRAEKALKLLDRAQPDDPWTLHQLGRVFSLTGRHGDAGLMFARAHARGHSVTETGPAILWNLLSEYVRAKDEAFFDKAKGRVLRELKSGQAATSEAALAADTSEAALAAEASEAALAAATSEAAVKRRAAVARPADPDRTYPFPLDRVALAAAVKAGLVRGIPERHTPRSERLYREAIAAPAPEGAIAPLSRLLERIPDHFDALVLLGDALRAAGRPKEAREEYLNAIFVRPLDPRPLAGLAEIALGAGNLDAAKEFVRRALAFDPGWEELGGLVERIIASEREAAAKLAVTLAAPETRQAQARGPNGFVHESAVTLAPDGSATFAAAAELTRTNRAGSPAVARASAGDRARVIAHVGRYFHVELTDEAGRGTAEEKP